MGNSPAETLRDLANAHAGARCLHVVAELGIADALGAEPLTAAELAAGCGADAAALHRLLRLLAAHGIFAQDGDRYSHTEASLLLRTDHPHSMRAFVRMIGMPIVWRGFTGLEQAARTGHSPVDWRSMLEYFEAHPDENTLFNQAMVGKSEVVVPAVVAAYDFSGFETIVDVGGGRGHLLQALLPRAPKTTGILFELPHVIEDAAAAASDRLVLAPGDFFADPLPPADAYVLMEVLHDWDDAHARQILTSVRRAAPAHARLLIVEAVVSVEPGPAFGKTLDVIMLAITGGRERTEAEYAALLRETGFELERVVPTPAQYSLLEAVAV